jgi:8-oxo-dGTP diphosphatase
MILRRFHWLVAILYRIVRLFQPKFSAGAVGVLFNKEGQVLLVEHAFHPKHPWGLPGGWVGRKENPALTVQREFLEELSLHIVVGPILAIEIPHAGHFDFIYLCQTDDTIGDLSYELLAFDWFDLGSLPKISKISRHAIIQAMEKTKETDNHDA